MPTRILISFFAMILFFVMISFFAIAFGLSWGAVARFIGFTSRAAVGVLPCLPAMLRAGARAGRFFARSSSARQP